MIGSTIDVAAAALVTALVMVAPGAALLFTLRTARALPWPLRPAAAVTATVLLAAPCLLLTMLLHRSIATFAALLALATIALAVIGALRHRHRRGIGASTTRRSAPSWRSLLAFGAPTAILAALATIDAPHVRSDTYWHVALARKLAEHDHLTSAHLAFEAGAPGNANYPLPVWHALIAVADMAPRVDLWFASWFLTIWLAPVAMLAFGAAAAALVGHERATLPGAWTFLAIVVLGYGPWYFASRYLGYSGQIAIFVVLPIVAWAFVRLVEAQEREPHLLTAMLASVAAIGVLHANYVLYPSLFALGGAALLLVGARERARAACSLAGMVLLAGAATLAVQMPWIMRDSNFLRGDTPPDGAPATFVRHRDVLTGSEDWFWLQLGSLATQPWLVAGALALPLALAWMRRRVGPWVLAGAAVAIVVTARVPWIVHVIDAAGSITPITRFDRVYPAAAGVLALAVLSGALLQRIEARRVRASAVAGVLAACALGTWWVDSVRDTRRVVVTPFVEARWVGGLDPMGLPLLAVWASALLVLGVAIAVRVRVRDRSTDGPGPVAPSYALATAFVAAIVVGLAPASVERARAAWQPQAYDRSARHDRDFVRVEVYPAGARRQVLRFDPRSVLFADFTNVRKVASLVPLQVTSEAVVRQFENDPVTSVEDAAALLEQPHRGALLPDYLVIDRANEAMVVFADAARTCGWVERSAAALLIFERGGARCGAAAQVDEVEADDQHQPHDA